MVCAVNSEDCKRLPSHIWMADSTGFYNCANVLALKEEIMTSLEPGGLIEERRLL